jgi:hypothetical protein
LSVAPASPRGAGARLQARAVLSAERGRFQAPGLLREQHLEPRTPNTITDRRRLQAELRLTARRGPSIGDEAILAGVRRCGGPPSTTAARCAARSASPGRPPGRPAPVAERRGGSHRQRLARRDGRRRGLRRRQPPGAERGVAVGPAAQLGW